MAKELSIAHKEQNIKPINLVNEPLVEYLDVGELESWCRFIRDRRWGDSQKRKLLAHFGSPKAIFGASTAMLGRVVSTKSSQVEAAVSETQLASDLSWLQHSEHHLITLNCGMYPTLLREIADPPIALFAIGNLALINEPQVAMVGSRRPTPVGARIAHEIAQDLSALGVVISSGMALGIDGISHSACVERNEPSVAVLGCGLDIVYPARNKKLFGQLEKFGLILSEYPLGVPPDRYTFPKRNRIVSGLSLGVVIVEAAERSGTLITARLSLEQNRELMVVPGSALSKQYEGSHRLLREGACLVSSASDVLQQLSLELTSYLGAQHLSAGLTPGDDLSSTKVDAITRAEDSLLIDAEGSLSPHTMGSLLAHIGAESTSVDDIILSSGLTAAQVSSILLALELDGAIAIASDGGYVNLA